VLKKYFIIYLLIMLNLARADFKDEFYTKFPALSDVKIVKSFENFYLIKDSNSENVFISDDFKILISGSVIDLETGQNLSVQNKLIIPSKFNISDLKIEDAIRLGVGFRKIYVFSDPKCPFCKQLELDFKKLENVSIYIFPLPFEAIHPGSLKISTSIWCSTNRSKAWSDYVEREIDPKINKCSTPIDDIKNLANRYKINATPTIIFEDGTIIPGAMTAEQINLKLKNIDDKQDLYQ